MFTVATPADLRVLNDRYLLAVDHRDSLFRVVSLLSVQYRELVKGGSSVAPTYRFALRKGSARTFTQSNLRIMFHSGRQFASVAYPSKEVINKLEREGILRILNKDSVKENSSELRNRKLDPKLGGWVIMLVNEDGTLTPSDRPRVHTIRESAETELDRLANEHVGKEFALLKVGKTARVSCLTVREFSE